MWFLRPSKLNSVKDSPKAGERYASEPVDVDAPRRGQLTRSRRRSEEPVTDGKIYLDGKPTDVTLLS